jgi:hypothetical protein
MWPDVDKDFYNKKLEEEMDLARKIVEAGHAKRKEMQVKVRMPLLKLKIEIDAEPSFIRKEIWTVILEELNIKNIVVNNKFKYPEKEVVFSDKELIKEGEVRDLIRQIQNKRKEMGLKPNQLIKLTLPKNFSDEKDEIGKKVVAKEVVIGDNLLIEI